MSFARSTFTRLVCAVTSLVIATSPALAEYQFRVPLEPHPVTVGGGTLSISTSSLDFGGVGVGAARQLYVDVFNSGEGSVSLSGISTSGSYFSSSSNCSSELAAGAGCRINVAFSPSSSGAATGKLSIRSSDVVSEYAISLSGYGQAGTLSAPGLTFPSTQQVGDAAAFDSVRVTNIGTAPVAVSGVSVVAGSDSFAQANNCGGTLQPGGYCTINVAFAPAAAGPRAGTIAVSSDADGSPLLIPLSGQGAQASAALSASSFGSEQVGSTKVSSVVLKNTGVGPLTISGMAVTGADYAEATSGTSTCGPTLAAGAECQYAVAFKPSAAGPRPGQASATTSAGVVVAALDGTGVPPSADLTAPSFGHTSVGGSSSGTATLKNTGIGALEVSVPGQGSVSGAGYSFESTTCSTSLQPGADCSIVVTFAPTTPGASSGALTVSTGAGAKTVALGSTGIQGIASITPASLQFLSEQVGSTSQLQALTVTNTGTDVLTFTGVGITAGQAQFAQSNDCGSVAVGQSCTVHVNFTPTAPGAATGTLSFVHNGGGMASVSLSGTGVSQSASIDDLAFGGVAVGGQQSLTTTLTNTGVGPLSITAPTSAAVSGTDFSFASSTCPTALPVGGSCAITVKFSPTAAVSRNGTLSIMTGAGSKTATLTATGQQAVLTFTPSSLGALANTQVGQTTDSSLVTLSNGGNVAATSLALAVPNGFALTNSTCGVKLNAGATCSFNVRFAPVAAQAYTGNVTATADAPSTTATLAVSGSGVSQSASLADVSFGGIAVGSNSTLTSTLTNTGVGPLSITVPTAGSVSGTDFSFVSTTCSSPLASGATCTVTVKFTPTAAAARVGTLTVTTGAGSRTANLSATGQQAVLNFTPGVLSAFQNTQVGQTADSVQVTLTNSGNATATALSLTAPNSFSIVNSTCSASLNAGSSCTFNVRFAPSAAQSYSGNVSASATAPSNAPTLAVTGMGVTQSATLSDIAFGNRSANSTTDLTSTLTNTGVGPLSLTLPTAASVTGTGFSFVSTTCASSLSVGESCSVTVRFSPTNNSSYSGSLSVATGAGTKTAVISGQGLQGTGIANPTSLTFPTTQVGQTAATQAVTVTNNGNTPLTITGVSVSPGALSFAQSNNCGATLATGSSCTINVSFTPPVATNRIGTLLMTHDGPGGVTSVALSGMGQNPSASITDVTFGSRAVASTTDLTATLSNTGVGPITVTAPSAASVSGSDFSFVSTTCSASLAAGGTCGVTVRFAPTTNVASTGTLAVVTSAGTQTAALSGTGQRAVLSWDASVAHNNTQVGQTDVSGNRTLTNTGNATATGLSFSAAAPFSVYSTTCGTTLAAGATCAVRIAFTPTATQSYSAGLVVAADSPAVTANLGLSGTGVSQAATISNVSFTGVNVGSTATAAATITNTGVGPLSIAAPGAGSVVGTDFSFSSTTCGTTLAASSSCTVTVAFAPTTNVTRSGTLAVSTGAGTLSSSLTGTGLRATLSWDADVAHNNTQVGQSDVSGTRTLTNSGNAAATSLSFSTAAPFSVYSTTCGTTLAAGATCTVRIAFTPMAAQTYSGSLTVSAAAPVTAANLPLSGTGVQGYAVANPSSLSFTDTQIGSTSSVRSITFTNSGSASMTVTGVSLSTGSSEFGQSNNCAVTLPVGGSCTVNVAFTPVGDGVRTGTLSVTHNGSGGVTNVSLSGTGQRPSATLTDISFGDIQVGQSTTKTSLLRNTGFGPLLVGAPSQSSISGDGYTFVSTTCPTTVAVGGTCTVTVQSQPGTPGLKTGTLSVSTSAGPISSTMYTNAVAPSVQAATSTTVSHMVAQGASSGSYIAIKNSGVGPITVQSLSYTGTGGLHAWWAANGNVGGYCSDGFVLQAGEACGAWMQKSGNDTAIATGTVTIATSAGSIAFNGTLTPVGLTYSNTTGASVVAQSGQSSTVYTMTISNPSPFTFYFPTYATSGGASNIGRFVDGNSGNFVITGTTCPGALVSGASCTVSIAANNATTAALYSTTFQPNGTFQQSGEGSNGTWSPGGWLVNMGTTIAPVYVLPGTTVSMNVTAPPAAFTVGATPATNFYAGSTVYGFLTWTWTNPASVAQAPTAVGYEVVQSSFGAASLDSSSTCKVGVSVPAGGTCTVVVKLGETTDFCANADVLSKVTTAAGTVKSSTYHRSGFCGY